MQDARVGLTYGVQRMKGGNSGDAQSIGQPDVTFSDEGVGGHS
jgi:hypothetical protein